MQKLLGYCLLILTSASAQADVWPSEHQWNDEWEDAYSEWIRTKYTENIFIDGEYQGIRHDCSDAVYFARLLFAYESRLPFVIRDPDYTGENSKRSQSFDDLLRENRDNPYDVVTEVISNDMDFFDHLEPRARLRRFIELVGRVTWSKSLMKDTYPIRLETDWFRPGVVAVLPRRSLLSRGSFDIHSFDESAVYPVVASTAAGHAQIVTQVDKTGVITYLKSTSPAMLQRLLPTTLNSFVPDPSGGSFRRWKQPQHYAMPDEHLPGYGLDQYELDGVFEDVMQQRLATTTESRTDKISRLANEVCAQLQQRIPVINRGWAYKHEIGDRCMSFQEFDAHSTPSRDRKIAKTLTYLLYATNGAETASLDTTAEQLDASCSQLQLLDGTF